MVELPGMPRKVLAVAQQIGVHNDCLVSERPCQRCSRHIMQAFDHFYSHCSTTHEMHMAIIEDFCMDLLEEEAS